MWIIVFSDCLYQLSVEGIKLIVMGIGLILCRLEIKWNDSQVMGCGPLQQAAHGNKREIAINRLSSFDHFNYGNILLFGQWSYLHSFSLH